MTEKIIIALDQGTTSSRTIAYNLEGTELTRSAFPYQLSFPSEGWVEQDANEVLSSQINSLKNVLSKINPKQVIALGITNQRETIVCWHKKTGQALAPAIVWQCRRTANRCNEILASSESKGIIEKTGLCIDAYFSATKIEWLLKNNPEIARLHKEDLIIFGTIDSWLIYNLTKDSSSPQKNFFTDSSNASRTMLYNLQTDSWDDDLLNFFGIRKSALCQIKASDDNYGSVKLLGLNAPILAVLGDQQSSLFGHGAHNVGDLKCTFGTGAFLLKNTGSNLIRSNAGLLSTVAWSLNKNGEKHLTYALEGSIFIAGALFKWFRDQLNIIASTAEVEALARTVKDAENVSIVPAFVGLGSPYWNSDARASILGITAGTKKAHLMYAALEAISHQVADLLELQDLKQLSKISIDGGMLENKLFAEILANICNQPIVKAERNETTAFGVFALAASHFCDLKNILEKNEIQTIAPNITKEDLAKKRARWKKAVAATISY